MGFAKIPEQNIKKTSVSIFNPILNLLKQLYPFKLTENYFVSDIYGGQAIHLSDIANGGLVNQRFKIYGNGGETACTGTITATAGSDQIIGTNTLFTSEFSITLGDAIWIKINTNYYKILSIQDETLLTLEVVSDENWTGSAINFQEKTIFSIYPDGTIADIQNCTFTTLETAEIKSTTDLNNLRIAYENLRSAYDDLRTKLKTTGLLTE